MNRFLTPFPATFRQIYNHLLMSEINNKIMKELI